MVEEKINWDEWLAEYKALEIRDFLTFTPKELDIEKYLKKDIHVYYEFKIGDRIKVYIPSFNDGNAPSYQLSFNDLNQEYITYECGSMIFKHYEAIKSFFNEHFKKDLEKVNILYKSEQMSNKPDHHYWCDMFFTDEQLKVIKHKERKEKMNRLINE
jgi:hypothetical protein